MSEHTPLRLAVLGAGAWGSALAISYARAGHYVTLWSHDAQHVAAMHSSRENQRYLPNIPFPATLSLANSLAACVEQAELVLIATPVVGLRPTLAALKPYQLPILWVCKGFEADSGLLPHEVVAEVLGPNTPCGALTGPSFAQEVAQDLPCAITLASNDGAWAQHWATRLHHPRLRLYANDDIIGAETGGAVKNILAIAAGIADGLGYGLNARAALITRGLAEISRLSEALGGRRDTLMGLAGMGDLILTCTGALSRNRKVGLALATGKPLEQILQELGHVAEGVLTTRVVVQRAARLGVEMPISQAVAQVLDGKLAPATAVDALLARDPKQEM